MENFIDCLTELSSPRSRESVDRALCREAALSCWSLPKGVFQL